MHCNKGTVQKKCIKKLNINTSKSVCIYYQYEYIERFIYVRLFLNVNIYEI